MRRRRVTTTLEDMEDVEAEAEGSEEFPVPMEAESNRSRAFASLG